MMMMNMIMIMMMMMTLLLLLLVVVVVVVMTINGVALAFPPHQESYLCYRLQTLVCFHRFSVCVSE